jgi:yecA family protein
MSNPLIQRYERWSSALELAHVMASAAELHGLIAGMLSAGVKADAKTLLPVLYDFLNDGQALPKELAYQVQQLIDATAASLEQGDFSFSLLVPSDDDSLFERLEALVEWSQAFLVGFAVQQTDLSLLAEDVREAIDQLTEVTRVDIHTVTDGSKDDNEEAYFLVLEHVRMMVFCCFNEVGLKVSPQSAQGKTLH